jgi:FkbM family methyltransferase
LVCDRHRVGDLRLSFGYDRRIRSSRSKVAAWVALAVLVSGALGTAAFLAPFFMRQFRLNETCCRVPFARNVAVTARELSGRVTYSSQIGQDKWVLETMFPGVTDGTFVDVGSGDGQRDSNTAALERRGWTGICVDPFPSNMGNRTCRVFKEVVWSTPGRVMTFQKAEDVGGLAQTLDRWKDEAMKAPSVELTTVTLDDILTRAKAPAFIHFLSLDIEGAELEALKAFPFDRIRLGAIALEHNYEEPKRTQIVELLAARGYRRVHSYRQDDFFAPAAP